MCRWIRDADVPGGKYHVPQCIGAAVYGPGACTCNPQRKQKDLEDRVAKLEAQVRDLRKAKWRCTNKA